MTVEILQTAVILILLIIASVKDIKSREIPNEISAAVAMTMILNFDIQNLWGLIAAAIFFGVALLTGKIGGGDVKLIMALSVVCGLWSSIVLLFFAQISMLVFYGVYVLISRAKGKTAEKGLPFVPFITIGYIISAILF